MTLVVGVISLFTTRSHPARAVAAPAATTSALPVTTIAPTTAPPTSTAPPSTTTSTTAAQPAPPDLVPLAGAPQSGEGHWLAAGRSVGGRVAVWQAYLRPPGGGSYAGIARLDTGLLDIEVYAGAGQSGGPWTHAGSIPPERRAALVAAFNGGFQLSVANGGFFADGRAVPPLRDGAASLVVHSDGRAEIDQWGRDAAPGPDIVAVRQNLGLLVDAGAPTPAAANPAAWGATLGGGTAVWRSGLGSDSAGHLYYVGGPGLTPASLAAVMVAAGASRAMELDINPQWVLFANYTDSLEGTLGTRLLPTMNYAPDHFFSTDGRDFVAAFARGAPSTGG